jgi:hypothetical protein
VIDEAQEQSPRSYALVAVAGCCARTVALLARRRIHHPRGYVATRMRFANGTSARVYRETVVDGTAPADPCVLVVRFRLRGVHGFGHIAFRAESLLNTPLFVGFPGFVSKLWLAHDENEVYRGVYEWDGPERAVSYARSLWRVLALVSAPGSIGYRVLPDLRRAELLAAPHRLDAVRDPPGDTGWWRPVEVFPATA